MLITKCRSCDSPDLVQVVDLGEQYLSEFRADDSKPPKHPLCLVVCTACSLAQLSNTAPRAELFHDSYSFKSGISDAIRRNLQEVVTHALSYKPEPRNWLDIASNDGTLLSFVPKSAYRVGIDPLQQFAIEAHTHADEIVVDFFDPAHFGSHERFDVITSVSMFYDLDDPNIFVAGVAEVLAQDGVWVIQQNYLPTMLQNNAIDNLSHEHLAYYSMQSLRPLLERHGLYIAEAMLDPINGGCFRTIVRKRTLSNQTDNWLSDENVTMKHYADFAFNTGMLVESVRAAVQNINADDKEVMIYGASTRGAVLWQAAGLTDFDVPYAVERNGDKVGRYFSAVGSLIVSEEWMREKQPDYLLVGPYWLRNDIVKREMDYITKGGQLIIPVPKMEVISKETAI